MKCSAISCFWIYLVLVLLEVFKDDKIPSSVAHFMFPDLVTWLLYLEEW